MTELVERLRAKIRRTDLESGGGMVSADGKHKFWSHGEVWQTRNPDGEEAAAKIEHQADTIARMREALEPFALFALEGKEGGEFVICKALFTDMKGWRDSPPRSAHLHKEDFVRARAALTDGRN